MEFMLTHSFIRIRLESFKVSTCNVYIKFYENVIKSFHLFKSKISICNSTELKREKLHEQTDVYIKGLRTSKD